MNFETENTEFKSQFTEEIYKEVIAFVNTEGGTIYVGISNDGEILGLNNVDDEYTRITNGIRDAIMPDVTMSVHYTIQDNNVVIIDVNEGSNKPYYLKRKGLKPSGVYVRQGTSSVQASPEQIRQMIKDSDGDTYESIRSLNQNLTFDAAASAFRKYGVDFGEEKFRALGITKNGIYTNLALLLSDQCTHTTKIAVFNDETCTEFRDSKEFGGSVLKQFEDAASYLALCNKTTSTIKGLVRTDKMDYPPEAIREALLNALIHREYSFSGSIIINVNESKMEFISLGGLLPGLSTEEIKLGISQPRNKMLAEVFHRLRLIESYGTGIRRIYKLYEGCPCQPTIETAANAFKISLPNMNEKPQETIKRPLSAQMERALSFIAEKDGASLKDIEEFLDIKQSRVYALTKDMLAMNLITYSGRGQSKKFYLK